MDRKAALKSMVGMAGAALLPETSFSMKTRQPLKGNILHSVCEWCYNAIPLEKLCEAAVEYGITSIDLLRADQ